MEQKATVYEASLFDGLSSTPIQVGVLLYSDRLVLHYLKEGQAVTQSWDMADIKGYIKNAPDNVQIRYGDFPSQTLEVRSLEFASTFKAPLSQFEKLTHHVVNSGVASLIYISVGVIAVLAMVYFFALPWVAEQAAEVVPQSYEVEMGEKLYNGMIKTEQVDSSATTIANQFAKQIDFETDYPIQVTVVESPIKNAFALPGGHIVVFSKLLEDMQSYKELVALLGHEAGHVKHRHTTKHIFRSLSGYLVISLIFGDLSGVTAVVLDNANQINQLSYSRSLETEADESGFATMKHNHVDANGMIQLFENLQKGNEVGSMVPEFLSTHPVTENRMALIKKRMKEQELSHVDHAFLEGLFQQLKKK